MDDSNYKSLLPQNTDFLNPEGPSQLPEIRTEAPAAPPPKPEQTEISEKPIHPDREEIIREIDERLKGFFGMARVREGRIKESEDAIKRTSRPLEVLKENGLRSKRALQEIPGSSADEAARNSAEIASRAEQQLDDTFKTIHAINSGEQFDFIKKQEDQLISEDFKTEIREALKIEDPEAREAKLIELNNKVRALAIRVETRANDSYSRSLNLQEGTRARRGQIKNRLDAVHYVLPSVREKLGDSYPKVRGMADEMGEAFHRFGIEAQHIESISLEFKLLAHTADELGISISQIFAALGAGRFI